MLPYTVHFENVPTATAAAQRILITDQLDPNLDWRTFRLKEIVFGKYHVAVPDNRAFYQGRIQLGEDLSNLQADISAGVDIITGQVTWTLTAIDPATGEQPPGALQGLLPPNDETGRGQGFVSYTVKARPSAPTGTQILNNATIVFDTQEPITTNTVTNTLDTDAPASAVAALPAESEATFTLSWSGDDPADGSGLQSFDIWVSDNDGPYQPFVSGTTETSAQFTGLPGHSYRFYSVARDNAGNVEAAPATPDAATTVQGQNPAPALTAISPTSVVAGGAQFTLTVTGTNFVDGSAVQWNGATRTTGFVSPTELRATIPTADIAGASTASVNVVNPAPGGGTSNALTFNILPPPVLQFASAAYGIGEGGGSATVTINRTGTTLGAVSVSYSTADDTASAGSDYTAASVTLNFGDGETSKTFVVPVLEDSLDERDETVTLFLSDPGGATLGVQHIAVLTIADNDATPSLSIGDATVTEGTAGTTSATFTIMLSAASGQMVSVPYSTADGTASAPSDYAHSSSTLTFSHGETSKNVAVAVVGDTSPEAHETFFVNLGTATNATVADGQGEGTINNDDTTLSVGDLAAAEGDSGTTAFSFAVTLSRPTVHSISVAYATADGTATAGSDYAAASGTLNIPASSTSGTISVQVNGDTTFEPDESFFVNLSGAVNAAVGDAHGQGTINNDEAVSTFQYSAATYLVGESGAAAVTVTRTGPTAGGVTVGYATSDGTATAGSDYAATSGTLTFASGEASKTFNIQILEDTLDEPDETVNLSLSAPVGGTLGAQATAILTITDDDSVPSLSVGDTSVIEGSSGTTEAAFSVTLSAASGRSVTVNYTTADGTAEAGSDYHAASGALAFAPGETSKTVTVRVAGDPSNEPDETFFLNLSGAANATLADAQGLGAILNDDTPRLAFGQASFPVTESAHFVTVTVTRTGDPSLQIGVDFGTSDGTASERSDYTAASGTLQFAAGETTKTFDVLLTDDAYQEPEETINLTLSNLTGWAGLGNLSAVAVVIVANDNPPPPSNPIDGSSDFVRQHYHDFLNREPDQQGLDFWVNEIEQCGSNAGCREVKRVNVSAAFFLSIEFQQTGYLVYRTYKAAYGDATSPNVLGTVPVVRFQEFLPDTRRIGQGVVVRRGAWEQQLNTNKNAYLADFVRRPRFLTAYPLSMTAAQFVDTLNQNAGGVLTQSERDQLVAQVSSNPDVTAGRVVALRSVAENTSLQQSEFRRAFVLMQYFGYLRRNPDDPQDADFRGWKFWLDKLNQFNGNFVQAEMVKAFLDSLEFRRRFGS